MSDSDKPMTVMLHTKHPLWDNLRVKHEGMQTVLTKSGFIVLLVFDPLSDSEAKQLQEATYRFGVLKMTGGFCFLVNTPIGEFDGPYAPGLAHPDLRKIPDEEALWDNRKVRLALTIHTLDGAGVVRALRFTTVSPEFSRTVANWHRSGLREWAGPEAWDAEIKRFYARYPTPGAAMKDAITCKGGD
jgi:hypothetical protein